ncbi:MAG: hypothetical protein WBY88_01525 [Desulfosarcina sp.]
MHTPFRILISAVLLVLGWWTAYSSWPQRLIDAGGYTFSEEEARRLADYPAAQYAYGVQAWMETQPEKAATYFRRTVSEQVLALDAWLKLAEAEAAMGHAQRAKEILAFTMELTEQVFKWRWSQALLARELAVEATFYRSINDLLSRQTLVQDALQLLHTHLDGQTSTVITALEPAYLPAYLDWLMRWGMAEESGAVWQIMASDAEVDKATALRYAHFLLSHKRIDAAVEIWRSATGTTGLTNPGFESDISSQGFDWRYWGEKDGGWELKRTHSESAEGDYALRIDFKGAENISFQHLYQIVPTPPGKAYRFSYRWKTRGITTDQGPFVEIFSYDGQALYHKGDIMSATHDWQAGDITFTVPADCRATVVRLRRLPSMRFDSKIRGTLWLDDFRLEKIETNHRPGPKKL